MLHRQRCSETALLLSATFVKAQRPTRVLHAGNMMHVPYAVLQMLLMCMMKVTN